MKNLLTPLFIVFISLIVGYIFGRFFKGSLSDLKKIRVYMQRLALIVINPIAFLGAVWVAPISNIKIISLPFVAAIAICSGGFIGYLYCKANKLGKNQTGALIPVSGFTNIGSIGAIVVFFFLGEPGFSLVPIYKLFEELVNYGIGFPVAKSYSNHVGERDNRLKSIIKDPFIIAMLSAVLIGLVLNVNGVKRPEFYMLLNPILITSATVLLLLSIGMAIKFTKMGKYIKHGISIAILKSILVPIIGISVAMLFRLGGIENGLVLKVVLILASMPAGFISLVPATIYDLDIDLANTGWLFSMLTLIYTMPLLSFLLTRF